MSATKSSRGRSEQGDPLMPLLFSGCPQRAEGRLAFLDDKEVGALMEWNAFIQTKTVERDPMLISNVHGNCCCNADDVITCRMFQTMTALLGALPGSQEQIASTGYHHASNEIGRIGFAFYGTNWTWCVLGIMG